MSRVRSIGARDFLKILPHSLEDALENDELIARNANYRPLVSGAQLKCHILKDLFAFAREQKIDLATIGLAAASIDQFHRQQPPNDRCRVGPVHGRPIGQFDLGHRTVFAKRAKYAEFGGRDADRPHNVLKYPRKSSESVANHQAIIRGRRGSPADRSLLSRRTGNRRLTARLRF